MRGVSIDMEKEMDLIEKKLDDADVETRWRYEYIDEKCYELEDEQLEVEKTIVELEVDLEVATILEDKEEIENLTQDIKKNKEYLDHIYKKNEVLEDLFDEALISLLEGDVMSYGQI